MNRKITLLSALFLLGFCFFSEAQTATTCPNNIDWETGTTSTWAYYRGSVYNPGTAPTTYAFNLTSCSPAPTLHTLTSGAGTDFYGGFPIVAPGGGSYSFKLGKDSANESTMRCQYQLHVPTTPGIYSLVYHYAVVLENPGHSSYQQPRFIVQAFDSTTGITVPCDSYQYVADGSVPGFLSSTVTGGVSDAQYKPWTTGNMKFPGENGRTVTVQFTAAGCTLSGHFGYGYLDMTCGMYANQILNCASGTTYLTGPDGYSAYQWTDSATYTASLGTSQTVAIASPTTRTCYAVILTPFTGYGCVDTLYTVVVPTQLVLSPSHDTSICRGNTVPLTAGATSPYTPITYSWGPAATLSCTTCSSPIATPTTVGTTVYYVTAVDGQGCSKTDSIHVTVIANPTAITGPSTVCLGTTATSALGATPSGGIWTSSATGTASIGSISGFATGVSVGNATITYTLGGACRVTRGITVNPLPGAISGPLGVCIGHTITLTDTSSGTWSSQHTGIATIGSTTGIVTGVSGGTTVDTFKSSATGCVSTKLVTVYTSPAIPVISSAGICVDSVQPMFDASSSSGGYWSATPSSIGTIGVTSGLVTGVSAGTLTVTYTNTYGCYSTTGVPIFPLPSAIYGLNQVCVGGSLILTDTTAGGLWGSSDPSIAFPPSITSGSINSYLPGTTTIYYTNLSTNCAAGFPITVNPTPSPINPAYPTVCIGQTATLTDPDPGTWSVARSSVATIGATTGVTSGIVLDTTLVTFTGVTGCTTTAILTVNPLPSIITGPSNLCYGTTITLSDTLIPGTWSTTGSFLSVNPTTGIVTGVAVGSQAITYTSGGCSRTTIVTVNTAPPPILTLYGSPMTVCQGGTLIISDAITGGVWTISPTSIATLAGLTTPTITGVVIPGSTTIGTATVTYSIAAGCSTSAIVTVNPLPGAITVLPVCVGSTVSLTSPSPIGGSWYTTGTYASISTSGTVAGILTCAQPITYVDPAGCARTATETVNPTPLPITATVSPMVACVGSSLTLHDLTLGGTWTSLHQRLLR